MINTIRLSCRKRSFLFLNVLVFFFLFCASSSQGIAGDLGITLSGEFPHPIFVDIEDRLSPAFDIALGGGGLSLGFNSNGTPIQASVNAVDLRAHWRPFDGAFFMGFALGIQNLSATATKSIPVPTVGSLNTNVALKLTSFYLTPHLGWEWVTSGGFAFGLDFGWQFPFAPSTTVTVTSDQTLTQSVLNLIEQTAEYQSLNSNVSDAGDKIGKISIPYITVLRLGYFF